MIVTEVSLRGNRSKVKLYWFVSFSDCINASSTNPHGMFKKMYQHFRKVGSVVSNTDILRQQLLRLTVQITYMYIWRNHGSW